MILGVLDPDDEERRWVPQSEDVYFRPLLLSASQGSLVNVLKVHRSGDSLGTVTPGQSAPPL